MAPSASSQSYNISLETEAVVSVEEYLHASYHPNCDYADGEVVERNVSERDHGICQELTYAYFLARR